MPRLDRKDGLSSPRKSFTVNVPPCHEVFAAELVWRFWVPIRRAIGRAIKTALWVEYEMLKHLPSEIELLRTLYSKLWAPFGHARDWLDDRRAALARRFILVTPRARRRGRPEPFLACGAIVVVVRC